MGLPCGLSYSPIPCSNRQPRGSVRRKPLTAKLAGQVPEAIRGAVAPLLETIDHLNEQIRYYDEMEEHIARERYPKYRLLDQVSGVGVHTALSFMPTIGDPERFQKNRMVGSFLGMRRRSRSRERATTRDYSSSHFSASCKVENASVVTPRCWATRTTNPFTAGGMPTNANLTLNWRCER
jgi:hypothetical protein